MNVAMFTNTYAPLVGGIEKSVSVMTEDLRGRGHRTLVVTPKFPDAQESDDLVHRVPSIKQVYGSQFSLHVPFFDGLADVIEHFQPDLIHAHQPFMLGDTGLRIARSRGIPLVYTNHTLYERYASWIPLSMERAERLAKMLPVSYANLCDLVIAPTESVRTLLLARGVERPVEVVPTGVETGFYQGGDGEAFRRSLGIPAGAFVAGHLGRLVPAKNLGHLARAVAGFLREEPDAWFMAVGEGEAAEEMKAVFREMAVADRVRFGGMLRGREIADAYAAMDVFVFSSLTDTQGLVLVEALAAGTPVVALDAPGPRDIVRPGREGLLLPAESPPEAMAQALARVMKEPGLHRQLALAGPGRAAEFHRTVCVKRLEEVYTRLLRDWEGPGKDGLNVWDRLQEAIVTEMLLIEEKATIASAAFREATGPAGSGEDGER